MRTVLAASVLAAALFLAGFSLAGGATTVKLTAHLNGVQEVPTPTGAHGSGVFAATLSGNTLTWRLTFSRLTGKAIAAHIHLGRQRAAGPVAIPLCGPCASGAHGRVTVTAKVRSALLGGGAYVNVHTAKNAVGEIRGQVAGPHGVMPAPPKTSTSGTTTTGGYGY